MYCTNCGKEIHEDTVFCTYCGIKILKEEEHKEEEHKEEEHKEEEHKEEEERDLFKDIDISIGSIRLCMILLIVGSVSSIINIVSYKNVNNFGQIIFGSVFIVSIFSLWKLNKIGATILLTFVSFKIISTTYYYMETKLLNLIFDQIFYIAIILLILVGWKKLK